MKKTILSIAVFLGMGSALADGIDNLGDYQCTTHGKTLTGTIESSNIFYSLTLKGYDKLTVTGTNDTNKLIRIHRTEGALSFDVWFNVDDFECKK